MKTALLLILLAVVATTLLPRLLPQEVPAKVLEAFAVKFPMGIAREWERETDIIWEVDFELEEQSYSASFREDGTWVQTERELENSELPHAVKKSISKEFPAFKISKAEKIVSPTATIFEVELRNGWGVREVFIDSLGYILQGYTDEDDKDDD